MTKKAKIQKITFAEWAGLQSGRISSISQGFARLSVNAGRFVMEGKSGTHTLATISTDKDRLNAHWLIFAGHDANRYS